MHTLDMLTKLKNSIDYHIDRTDAAESDFRRGLVGGLRMGKLYVQQLIDDYWQETARKIINNS